MKTKNMYMHTLNEHPASWSENYGGYIYFCEQRNSITLQPDLKTIRKQQKHDQINNPSAFTRYGHRIVRVNI